MKSRMLVATVGKAVAASALLMGALGVVGATAASASNDGNVQLFVQPAPAGTDGSNNCTLASNPCATIGHAIAEEAIVGNPAAAGNVINVAPGTYGSGADAADTLFAGLTTANNNLTIIGSGKNKKDIIAPSNCGTQTPTGAIVNTSGLTGVTVQNLFFNGVGTKACTFAAIYMGGGSVGDAAVDNIIESDSAYGILIIGSATQTASGSAISNTIAPVSKPCTTTVKGPDTGLNADWTAPADLIVKKIPTCAGFGDASFTGVVINGVSYNAAKSPTKNTIVLTSNGGSPNAEIPDGSTVTFNTSLEVASFLNIGIACGGATDPSDMVATCAISDNTVTGGGTTYTGSPPPIGIDVTDNAQADVDGNTVSGVATTGCATVPAECGIGIGLTANTTDGKSAGNTTVGANVSNPNTTTAKSTGNGNKLSSNDVGLLVEGGVLNSLYNINANTESSYNAAGGILAGLVAGTSGTLTAFQSNSIGGSLEGHGLVVEGTVGQTIGGLVETGTPAPGNTLTGNGAGLILVPSTAPPVPSDNNLIENNTFSGNTTYGVLIAGNFQPTELISPVGNCLGLASCGNTFNSNHLSGNGTLPAEAAGGNLLDGTGWGGTAATANCITTSNLYPSASCSLPLYYEGATVTEAAGQSSITLAVQSGAGGGGANEFVPAGTLVYVGGSTATTYFVKTATVVGNITVNITLQVMNPALQAGFTLAAGANLTLNPFTSTSVAAGNIYGSTFATQNSCTPAGTNAAPNVFGSSNGSAELNTSTGGVDASYIAC